LDLSPFPLSAVGEAAIAVRAKVPAGRLHEILSDLVRRQVIIPLAAKLYIHRDTAAEVEGQILAAVADFHRQWPESLGIPPDQLRQSLSIDRAVVDEIVARLKGDGRLAERSQRLALPEYRATFRDEDAKLLEAVEYLFREAKFSPPGREEVARQTGAAPSKIDKVLAILRDHQRLVQVEEGLWFHGEAVARAREILADHFRKEGRLDSVQFKYLLDTTRKFALPLLDYLDRLGVTRRVGNTRYPRDVQRT
jgi:selenocysteine-specific elongation factor